MSAKQKKALAAVVLAIVSAWLLWPSRYSRVKNLASPHSSILAFGDSLTAGYGAGPGEDFPAGLSRRLGVSIVNLGVSGDTTQTALARIDADVIAANPRMVIVGLGGNDFLGGVAIATTEANLRTIVKKIQAGGSMVVLLGFTFPSLTADYAEMYERIADDEHCLLVPGVLKGILIDPALKSDEIHPNARGYALMADRIAPPVKKLLEKANDTR